MSQSSRNSRKSVSCLEPQGRPPRIESTALLGKSQELVIVHNSREYRLRLTRNGKLILTA
jgi:hemin uptake protein HemP